MSLFTIHDAVEAPYRKRAGIGGDDIDDGRSNNAPIRFQNAAGTANVTLLNLDSSDLVMVNNEINIQAPREVTVTIGANGNQGSQHIWGTNKPCRIVGITEVHKTAGSDSSAVTGYVEKLSGTTAVGSGLSMMTGTFNLKGTAATTQTATLSTANPRNDGLSTNLILAAGDRVGWVSTGTKTSLAGVQVTLWVIPGGNGHHAVYHALLNSDIATQTFHIANRPQSVVAAYAFWGTAGSDAGTVTLDITKDASATAAGGGTSILTAAVSLKTAANTFNTLTLSATASVLKLSTPGDRISFKLTGTKTALADLTVVVVFSPTENRKEFTYVQLASDVAVDMPLWTLSRDYQLMDISAVWGTVSTSNDSLFTRDSGTTAPGAGAGLITDNANAGFLTSGTINVPIWGTLVAERLRWFQAGDRLGLKNAGTTGSQAGLTITASFRPR